MKIDCITIFPEMFTPMKSSIMGRAQSKNLLLVYLAVKCAIVVVGHWFEGFMNLARYLEHFRY